MKLNLDLFREIMISIEDHEPTSVSRLQSITPRQYSGTEPQNYHHINMLIDNGYVDIAGRPTMDGIFGVKGLTLKGHEFLNAIREKSIWDHTKRKVGAAGGWTLDLVLAVATEELKRRLLGAANG